MKGKNTSWSKNWPKYLPTG